MEMDKLVGREFVVKDVPLVYVITAIDILNVKAKAVGYGAIMTLPIEAFMSAYRTSEISFVGEPLFGIKKPGSQPIEEPTSEEEEPTNFFSFDDL